MSIDAFEFWEQSFSKEQLPEFPTGGIDSYIDQIVDRNEFDAIKCAQALQHFIRSRSSSIEAEETDVRKGVHELNFRLLARYINRAVVFNLESIYEPVRLQEAADMMELNSSLRENGIVQAGGFMDSFITNQYYDQSIGDARPEISLLLKRPRFIDGPRGNGLAVTIPNTLTVPITAITDYKIEERK